MVQREILAVFEGRQKRAKFQKNGEAMPTKIGLHAFHINPRINLYLYEIFQLILFFDPHGLKGKFSRF